jgi:uncharacterized protein with GYD domain
MPRFLFKSSYSAEGLRGLLKEGGTSRQSVVEKLAADLGGTIEAFYYGFGEEDVYVIAELPDNATAAALALTVSASGAAAITTTVLLTPEEVDAATHRSVNYRPPGR